MAQERIPLGKLLQHITTEIRRIHHETAHEEAVMKFKECEFEFAIETEDKGDGGLNVYVLKLSAGTKRTESNTIKIKYSALDEVELVAQIEAPAGTRAKPKRTGKKVT